MPIRMTTRAVTLKANKATRLLFANQNRKSFTIFNGSSTDAYIGTGPDVATSGFKQGLPCKANGGSIVGTSPDVYTGEIWAISTAQVTLNVVEEVEV